MKKILLLFARQSVIEGNADPIRLTHLLNQTEADIQVESACFEDLVYYMAQDRCEIIDTVNNAPLTEYDAIYLRYWGNAMGHAIAVTHFCRQKGIPFVDREAFREGSFNKLTQYINLFEAGVAFPRTLVAEAELLVAHYKQYDFTFPLILKSVGGTRGKDNYLAQNEQEMRKILSDNAHLLFVLQEFIPNNGDYRVIVMGDEVVMVIERVATGESHLNNTSQGGSAKIIPVTDLPDHVRAASIRAAKYFAREIAGVDMVESTTDGAFYCFEVNRSPQIEHASFEAEKATVLAEYLHSIAK